MNTYKTIPNAQVGDKFNYTGDSIMTIESITPVYGNQFLVACRDQQNGFHEFRADHQSLIQIVEVIA